MKTKRENFPLVIKAGSSVVKIYRGRSKGYSYFRLAYHLGGRRKFQNFKSLEAAKSEAAIQAAKLSRGDIDGALLTGKDRLVYGRALEAVRAFGVPLDAAATEYAEAKKTLGKFSLTEAARFFIRHHGQTIIAKPVAEIVNEIIADKTAAGRSVSYVADLRYRLGSFAKAFNCQINIVTGDEIQRYLTGLNLSARSYNNFLRTLGTLFEYAKAKRYLTRDFDALEGLSRRKEPRSPVEIFSPEEMARLLGTAEPELAACLAITAFAGLRSEEVVRLEWADTERAKGFIEVAAHKAKTAARRLVGISPNLQQWLALAPRIGGHVWPHSRPYYFEALAATAKAARVPWKQNALRHSFISYRLAEVQDVNRVALEAGNSPQMVFRNYRELVTPAQSSSWFALSPKQAANVVPFQRAATG